MKNETRQSIEGVATIEQVAERAGVSSKTVARALSGGDLVKPATRERIQAVVRELNYVPNPAARALVKGKTRTIAVLTGAINEEFYGNLLHLLEIELSKSDYKLVFLPSRELNRDLLPAMSANAVDGIITVDSWSLLRKIVQAGISFSVPCVFAGVGIQEWAEAAAVDMVQVDLSTGVRDALNSMLESGCQRIAFLTPRTFDPGTEVRTDTYLQVMAENGMRPEIIYGRLGTHDLGRDLTQACMAEYLAKHGCPDGLFCLHDGIAIAAYRALRDANYRIPEDVQLVGCNGIFQMKYFDPPLSTIVQPSAEMCALAWQFLQRRIEDRNCPRQTVTLKAHLEVRRSLKAFMRS